MRFPAAALPLCAWFAISLAGLAANAEPIHLEAAEPATIGLRPGAAASAEPLPSPADFGAPAVPADEALRDAVNAVLTEQATQNSSSARPNAARATPPPANADAAPLAFTLTPSGDERPAWERELGEELKGMVRPVYAELEATGVIDAVHEITSYLAVHDARSQQPPDDDAAIDDGLPPEIADAKRGAGTPKSAAQIEKEKLINALLIEQWIAAIKPWLFALIALFLLWQLVVLGLKVVHWQTRRRHKRAGRRRRQRQQHSGAV